MNEPVYSFGAWVRLRRQALVLTQEALARRVGCAEVTIRKIESDERRPSAQIAELLAQHLAVPSEQRERFVRVARGVEAVERLTSAGAVQLVVAPLPDTHAPHDAPAGFLPVRLTSFVGRTRDVAELTALLAQPAIRLITLVGPGGIGKTSLAIAVAASSMRAHHDAVWFVDLAPVHAPSDVARAIVQTLAIPEVANVPLTTRLLDWLRDKRLMLVLDNFEQVLDGAPIVGEILRTAPYVRLLVTSRMALRVQGEREYPVAPLGIDPIVETRHSDADVPADAVMLFVERAQAIQPGFTLTDANAPVITSICSRLDGLPLAIELAASRVKMFTPQALLTQLDSRDVLNVLQSRARDVVARQQTMRATIEWSYALLEDAQRDFFLRLGIFVGGWSLQAAESVCHDLALPTLAGLEQLVEHSLVQLLPAHDEPRFRLLETIRAFALEQLEQHGMLAAMRERHARFFVEWAETMEPRLRSSEQIATLARIDEEHDNLRAALGWAHDSQDGHVPPLELGLRLAVALAGYWRIRGHWDEYLRWIHSSELANALPQQLVARMLLERVEGYEYLHETDQAQLAAQQSLARFERSGERWLAVRARLHMAWGSFANAAFDEALRLLEISLVEAKELGAAWLQATVQGEYATLLAEIGQNERAVQYCDEAIVIARQTSAPLLIATLLYRRGRLGHGMSDYALEQRYITEALRLAREVDNHELIGSCLHALWAVAGIRGDYDAVKRIGVEYLANQRSLNNPVWTAEVLADLALGAIDQRDEYAAQSYLDQSRTLTDTAGKPPLWLALYGAGRLAELQGDTPRAEQAYTACLAGPSSGYRDMTFVLARLAWLALAREQPDRALAYGREVAQLWRERSMMLAMTLDCVEAFAAALVANNATRQAVRLWSAIEAFRTRVGNVRAPVEQPGYDQYVALARQALGDTTYEAEWRAGAAQTWQQATDDALRCEIDRSAMAPTAVPTATSEHASELALAAEIQAGLLPASIPQLPGWHIVASLRPALEIAGDFYDCIALPDGRMLLVIADVAGKGLGAALYMATGRALIRSLTAFGIVSPAELMKGVNTRLLEDTHAGLFITACIGLLDPATSRLTYANAGHPPAIISTNNNDSGVRLLGPTGLVLGVEPGVSWREEVVTLDEGQQVLLYTDGVTEAQNAYGAFFETERLLTIVCASRNVKTMIEQVNTTVMAFAGDAAQFDDITLLAIQRVRQASAGR